MNTLEIADNIHVIENPHRTYFVTSCLIVGESLTLIDAGREESPEGSIYPYIKKLGRDPSEISHLILTHAHWDHCAGAATIKSDTGCKIGIHQRGKPYLEDPELIVKQLTERFPSQDNAHMANFEAVKADITYKDGDIIDLGGKKLEIIHILGHSADSISIVDNDLGVYICGDSMQGGGSTQPLIFHNATEYTASAKRLLQKPIKIMVNGHPFRPYNKGVLRGSECSEHIQESLREVSNIRSNALETLRAAGKPMGLTEISERSGLSRAVTVGCVLEAMIEDREAEKILKNGNVLWRAK